MRRPAALGVTGTADFGRMRTMKARLFALALSATLSWPGLAPAQQTGDPVDLELVLAVDVSWSMDYEEQLLQRGGYIAGFRHPEVVRAIESGLLGRIAVTYVEWAGADLQSIIVPWTLI